MFLVHGKKVDWLHTVAALGSSAFRPVKFTADDCFSEHCRTKGWQQFPRPRTTLKPSLIYHGHTKYLEWVCGDEHSHSCKSCADTNIGKGHVRQNLLCVCVCVLWLYYIFTKLKLIQYKNFLIFLSHIVLISISRVHTGLPKYSGIFRILECVYIDYCYWERCVFSPSTHDTVN